ncbi:substrate-binding domain-containing protein [Clostridium sp. SHJSY1]|uniref:substrate-binding domain-containing protein n=1 Tax=Clostridium sp. SHJSY1 TaxID=2942483 RepID=UPI0028761AF3|nr:substrate-binding domain-containing protein [Clostridium sp. SHJSY1]MDS0524721.1 substrate-binding domain-containing protein [Clostridium sp. SHJSY1]
MKILRKIIVLIQVILIIFALTSTNQINTFASSKINVNNRKIANIAVLLHSFEDLYLLEVKQSLEDIQKENSDKVKFTFYDGKNNIVIQNATINSLLKSNVDLFILDLVDVRESIIKDVISDIQPKNVPIMFMEVPPDVVSKVSKYYDKDVFLYSTSSGEGNLQGKILVDAWNSNKNTIDRNHDDILQYILLKGEPTSPYTIERSKDALLALNNAGIKTEELAQVNANWFKELAKDAINNLFLGYDGKIEAIIANNDAMAIGAIESLQKYGYNTGDKNKTIAVVGIDGLKEAKDLIDKGYMTGTLIQDTRMVSEAFYNIAMNLINNKNPINNTNYTLKEGSIVIPESYTEYTNKANTP